MVRMYERLPLAGQAKLRNQFGTFIRPVRKEVDRCLAYATDLDLDEILRFLRLPACSTLENQTYAAAEILFTSAYGADALYKLLLQERQER